MWYISVQCSSEYVVQLHCTLMYIFMHDVYNMSIMDRWHDQPYRQPRVHYICIHHEHMHIKEYVIYYMIHAYACSGVAQIEFAVGN